MLGMKKPVHILQMESAVRKIVNMAAIAVIDAQDSGKGKLNQGVSFRFVVSAIAAGWW